jgi:hypothetical protein
VGGHRADRRLALRSRAASTSIGGVVLQPAACRTHSQHAPLSLKELLSENYAIVSTSKM